MEAFQCQDEEIEFDSSGMREPFVVIRQWTDMLAGRFVKKLVSMLELDSRVEDR